VKRKTATDALVVADDRQFATQEAEEIRGLLKRAARDIVTIGQKLIAVKARLSHGQWGEWLRREFDWDGRTAQRFMSVGERFKNDNLSDLNIAPSALYLLAAPSTPETIGNDILARARAGERITHRDALEAVRQAKELLSIAKQADDVDPGWPEWVEPDTRAALTVMAIKFPDDFDAMCAARIAEMFRDQKAAELLPECSDAEVRGWAAATAARWALKNERIAELQAETRDEPIDVEALEFAEQFGGDPDYRADIAKFWRETYAHMGAASSSTSTETPRSLRLHSSHAR
jgi:Protein of unknown function (DUF3102)